MNFIKIKAQRLEEERLRKERLQRESERKPPVNQTNTIPQPYGGFPQHDDEEQARLLRLREQVCFNSLIFLNVLLIYRSVCNESVTWMLT